MGKLVFDDAGKRKFETGVSSCVLFPAAETGYAKGVAWNGVTSITESPSGAEPTEFYADDILYGSLQSAEKYEGTIEAFTYPDEFGVCDGSVAIKPGVIARQQPRKAFCLCYKTVIGNDSNPKAGYLLHIIYGCKAQPSERQHATINETPAMMSFSWAIKATPVAITGAAPSATLTLDSTKVDAVKMALIEDKLYGTTEAEPEILLPDEIATIIGTAG